MKFFRDFSLIDMPFSGGEFAWSVGARRDSHSLDIFLVITDWEGHFFSLV